MKLNLCEHTVNQTMENFILYKETQRYIDEYIKTTGLKNDQVRILDWGCGTGRTVLYLKSQGFEVYGVDINKDSIEYGKAMFQKQNLNINDFISIMGHDIKTKFPDGFFNIILSESVFEHISDLKKTANEIRRITSSSGINFHHFPPKWVFLEPHFFIPLIHWLPKNKIRKYYLYLLLRFGLIRPNKLFEGENFQRTLNIIYEYLDQHTFYRSTKEIKKILGESGFQVEFITVYNPKINKKFIRFKFIRSFISYILVTFFHIEIYLKPK